MRTYICLVATKVNNRDYSVGMVIDELEFEYIPERYKKNFELNNPIREYQESLLPQVNDGFLDAAGLALLFDSDSTFSSTPSSDFSFGGGGDGFDGGGASGDF